MHYFNKIIYFCFPILLAACSQKPSLTPSPLENCWSIDTQMTTQKLAQQMAVDIVSSTIIKNYGSISADKQNLLQKNINISLDNYFVSSYDPITQHLSCGASISLLFKKSDNTTKSSDSTINFDMYKGQNGYVYTIQGSPLYNLLISAQ